MGVLVFETCSHTANSAQVAAFGGAALQRRDAQAVLRGPGDELGEPEGVPLTEEPLLLVGELDARRRLRGEVGLDHLEGLGGERVRPPHPELPRRREEHVVGVKEGVDGAVEDDAVAHVVDARGGTRLAPELGLEPAVDEVAPLGRLACPFEGAHIPVFQRQLVAPLGAARGAYDVLPPPGGPRLVAPHLLLEAPHLLLKAPHLLLEALLRVGVLLVGLNPLGDARRKVCGVLGLGLRQLIGVIGEGADRLDGPRRKPEPATVGPVEGPDVAVVRLASPWDPVDRVCVVHAILRLLLARLVAPLPHDSEHVLPHHTLELALRGAQPHQLHQGGPVGVFLATDLAGALGGVQDQFLPDGSAVLVRLGPLAARADAGGREGQIEARPAFLDAPPVFGELLERVALFSSGPPAGGGASRRAPWHRGRSPRGSPSPPPRCRNRP